MSQLRWLWLSKNMKCDYHPKRLEFASGWVSAAQRSHEGETGEPQGSPLDAHQPLYHLNLRTFALGSSLLCCNLTVNPVPSEHHLEEPSLWFARLVPPCPTSVPPSPGLVDNWSLNKKYLVTRSPLSDSGRSSCAVVCVCSPHWRQNHLDTCLHGPQRFVMTSLIFPVRERWAHADSNQKTLLWWA